jgi:hypothetical protein
MKTSKHQGKPKDPPFLLFILFQSAVFAALSFYTNPLLLLSYAMRVFEVPNSHKMAQVGSIFAAGWSRSPAKSPEIGLAWLEITNRFC